MTNKKTKGILSSDDLNSSTGLILINAVYFKGLWRNKFDVARTLDVAIFCLSDRGRPSTIDVHRDSATLLSKLLDLHSEMVALLYAEEF